MKSDKHCKQGEAKNQYFEGRPCITSRKDYNFAQLTLIKITYR